MKKKHKFILLAGLLALVSLTLSACSGGNLKTSTPPHGGIYGWIFRWISLPLQNIMLKVAHFIGGVNGAGWAIVIITLVVRLILLPLMLNQQRKAVTQQEKMSRLQPQIKLIQKALRHKPITPQQQMQLSTWQRQLYAKNNVSLIGGIGCLPLLIQMPIMIGIYQAVAYSIALKDATFFGISLSNKSLILAIIATLFAVIQGYLSLIGVPASQKKSMQSMMFMNPIMTLFFSLTFSGSLALYWAAGNLVLIFQQIIVTFIITPKEKQRISRALKDKPIQQVVSQAKVDALFSGQANKATDDHDQKLHQNLRRRNQGKQKHH